MTLSLVFKILATILFSLAVLGKFSGMQKEKFTQWGYGTTFMYALGILELVGAAALWFCPLPHNKYVVFLLIGVMLGAWFTLLKNPSAENKPSWITSAITMLSLVGYYFTTFS